MDTTTKIDCQVGDVFRADCVMLGPDQSRFQGRDFFRNREHRYQFVSDPQEALGVLTTFCTPIRRAFPSCLRQPLRY